MADTKKEVAIARVFDAPVELVWKAWTEQDLIKKWWGPRGVTNPTCEWDARPGGKINIVMLAGKELGSAAGMKWPMRGAFKEVTPKRRLVFTSDAIDDVQDILISTDVVVDFKDLNGKTKMDIRMMVTKAGPKSEMALRGMEMGWNQQIDKLGEELAREHLKDSGHIF